MISGSTCIRGRCAAVAPCRTHIGTWTPTVLESSGRRTVPRRHRPAACSWTSRDSDTAARTLQTHNSRISSTHRATGTHVPQRIPHRITCHPAEVTFSPLPPAKLVLDLSTPARRQSSIQVLTGPVCANFVHATNAANH